MNITLKDLKASLLNDLRNETFKHRYFHFTDHKGDNNSIKFDSIASVKWWKNAADIKLENGNGFTVKSFDDLVKLRKILVGDDWYTEREYSESGL